MSHVGFASHGKESEFYSEQVLCGERNLGAQEWKQGGEFNANSTGKRR